MNQNKTPKNDLLLRALRGEDLERAPVWMMRQAGRYLPEYRAVRAKSDFFGMVQTPELAAEVTIQPVRRFGVDAAIIFSDILVIPQALGLTVEMREHEGPEFLDPIQTASDLSRLKSSDVQHNLSYVFEAISLTVKELQNEIPLIGFAGAPFTILMYMTKGKGSRAFSRSKRFLYENPAAAHEILERISQVTSEYLIAQVKAGASALQLFDSWAGLVSPDDYREFSLPYLAKIIEKVREHAPVIVFAKDASWALKELSRIGASALGLDWTVEPGLARKAAPELTLQGNLDPTLLYAPKDEIRARTKKMLEAFGKRGYIANLGHGLLPDHDPEHVKVFVDTVKEHVW